MAEQVAVSNSLRRPARLTDLGLLVLCNLMFGAQYPATKTSVTSMGPVFLSLLTFVLGAFCLVPFFLFESRAHPDQPPALALFRGRNLFPFLMATALGFLPASVVLAWGIERSLATNAALLTLSIPVFTAMLASLVREERMNRWRWLSFVLGITGAVISSEIDWRNLQVLNARYLLGNGLILIGCSGSAFTNVFSKGLLERFQPIRLLMTSYLFTGLICLLLLVWLEPVKWGIVRAYPKDAWVGLGILGFFSWGISMVLFFRVLSRLEVTQVSLSIYLLPFFGVLLSAIFLKERITPAIVAGGLLVLAGTTLILFADNRANLKHQEKGTAT
ncbi:MAG TPA: DMT family transporter [Terriglobia bacterium]|nr:DMT family transporter [Terriglobia bacterium]